MQRALKASVRARDLSMTFMSGFDDAAAEHSGSDQNLHVLIESPNVNLTLHLVFILAYPKI
jgi:hypothetical protein